MPAVAALEALGSGAVGVPGLVALGGGVEHGLAGHAPGHPATRGAGTAYAAKRWLTRWAATRGDVAMEHELPQFGLTVHHHDEVATLSLRGELDLHAADQVRAVAAGLLDEGVRRIEIDAGELAFVDSSGFQALLDVRHDAAERNVEVAVVAASERLRWVAQVTGVDGLLPNSG